MDIRNLLRLRRDNIRQWIDGPADYFGECDDCHHEVVALWNDVDTEGCGDFALCRSCWKRRLHKINVVLNKKGGVG